MSNANGSLSRSLFACLSYGGSSLSIILINKWILTEYDFKYPMFMAFCHMCMTLFFLVTLKSAKLIHFSDFSFDNLSRAWPMSLTFIANIVVGLVSVKYVSIPMFTTLRRLTGLITLLLDWLRTNKRPENTDVMCIMIMISGALVAGWGDLHFTFMGYAAVMVNNLLTATYLVMSKSFTDKFARAQRRHEQYEGGKGDNEAQPPSTSLNKFGLLFYNAIFSIPFLFTLCLIFDDFSSVRTAPNVEKTTFQGLFFLSAVNAFAINWATMYCTEVTSPLTTSVTGQTKNILVTLTGFMLYSDSDPNPRVITGVSISLIGSLLFAYIKFQKSKSSKTKSDSSSPKDIEEQRLIHKSNSRNNMSSSSNVASRANGSPSIDVELGKNGVLMSDQSKMMQ